MSVLVRALLSDGSCVDVVAANLGWREDVRGYVTRFDVQGAQHFSEFEAAFHTMQVCPEPQLRLAHDLACLEEFLERRCGATLLEIEELD